MSQLWHPFSILVEMDSEEIVCDNSVRFSGRASIFMVKRIIKKVEASSLPIAEKQSEICINPLITES